MLYFHTQLYISSNSSSDSSSVNAAAAAFIVIIIIVSHSNTYVLFQVYQLMQKLLTLMSYLEMGIFQQIITQWTSAQMVAAS
jgi:hypothetical protein